MKSRSSYSSAGVARPSRTSKGIRKRLGPGAAAAAGAALFVLFAAAAILFYFTLNQKQTVYLVNGLREACTIEVNGDPVKVEPGKAASLQIRKGNAAIRVPGKEAAIIPKTIKLDAPIAGRVIVINPDRLAILVRRTTQYDASGARRGDPLVEYQVNQDYQDFKDVDDVFQASPDSLGPGETASNGTRASIDVSSAAAADAIAVVSTRQGAAEAAQYVRRLAEFYPEDPQTVALAAAYLPPKEFVALARPLLDATPPDMGIHAAYIAFMKHNSPGEDLAAEYRARLAKDPANNDLKYLLAEASPDPAESERLLREATQGPAPSVRAGIRLARLQLSRGEFVDAYAGAAAGIASLPGDRAAREIYDEACLAAGRLNEFLTAKKKALDADPADADSLEQAVVVLAMQGKSFIAADLIKDSQKALEKKYGASAGAGIAESLKTRILLGEGKHAEFLDAYGQLDAARQDFIYSLELGDFEKAKALLQDNYGKQFGVDYLFLYAAAEKNGSGMLAKDSLARALGDLESLGGEYARAAKLFRANTPPGVEQMRSLDLPPDQKRIVLAALGVCYPAIRQEAFQMALLMNYNLLGGHFLIREIADGGGEPQR